VGVGFMPGWLLAAAKGLPALYNMPCGDTALSGKETRKIFCLHPTLRASAGQFIQTSAEVQLTTWQASVAP
jgi:hypothetical protein